ncbi:hypothetical protein H9N28_08110 [Rhodobacter capsulatus]|uniref:hypothetical protein n=1 Tax=Rhodobacter capsulatus TaxID=1061 RepID=UPI0006DD2E3C|nr:hypothetical protein [Rhodobacter capsulatus]KQB13208.1 hypothetical protein AP071_17210 [Rhodobacter capsulatus]KQB15701.1 hypothetical protein AP073_13700 [Rhodobacter capsulatus]PZX21327.1 hypothetical protein LY44_03446 [Rhodobacter capsulatus]QNR64760.1 hypothetical protein H9N28_08110 [Rhodobacter capsulatus]
MSHNTYQVTENEAVTLAAEAAAARRNAPQNGFRPAAITSDRHEVTIRGGQIVEVKSASKTLGVPTVYVDQPRPGFIKIPGSGETTVAAAKAAGFLPHTWQEGDKLPFDDAPKGPQSDPKRGSDKATEAAQEKPQERTVAEHRVKVAGDILDRADTALGAEVTDSLINAAVESGELPEEGLPEGFTPVMVKQVYQGYVAQADAVLAPVGASVALLQDMLTDDELRQARHHTLSKNSESLADLGRSAVNRLAMPPKTDPEGFMQMVADMSPAERKCIDFDKKRGEWLVKIPGKPVMSYGAAVHMGLIRV